MTMTPVKLGATEGENAEVQSGVEPGNLVVVDGADKLRDGSKVELVDPNARRAGQATPPEKGKGPPAADKSSGDQGRRGKRGG